MRRLKRLIRNLNRKLKRRLIRLGELSAFYGAFNHPGANLHRIPVQLTFSLNDWEINEIIRLALKGGINYWCRDAMLIGRCLDDDLFEFANRSWVLLLHDAKGGRTYRMSLTGLLEGFRKFITAGGNVDRNAAGRIDICDIDTTAADEIVQYAVFGNIKYR